MFTENIGQPGAEGVARAGLDERGQKLSKQDVRVKQRVSVALFVSSAEEGEGSADETIEDRREGESERRLHRKVTCGGACAMSGVSVRLEVMRKWSEVIKSDFKTHFRLNIKKCALCTSSTPNKV